MSAHEFAFLALGLALGVASGAALVEVLRSRPPAPREVRVTVAPDSVPTRSSTLAADPFAPGIVGPAAFGPGDRRAVHRQDASMTEFAAAFATDEDRTPVPSPARAAVPTSPDGSVGIGTNDSPASDGAPDGAPARVSAPVAVSVPAPVVVGRVVALPASSPLATAGDTVVERSVAGRPVVGIAIRPEADGLDAALRAAEARAALVLDGGVLDGGVLDGGVLDDEGAAMASVAVMTRMADRPVATTEDRPGGGPDGTGAGATRAPATGPCAELQAIAEDRCAVAARARDGATAARDALREAQRTYDDHVSRAEGAAAAADPRAIQRAKEAAQLDFRAAREAAPDRDALDRAAAAWLASVNRINMAMREATAAASREQAAANELVMVIERLVLEADAARITAEAAEEACLTARQAVAECQEEAVGATARPAPPPPELTRRGEFGEPGAGTRYPAEVHALTRDEPAEAPADRDARILRILRGDGEALRRTVAELAGDDPGERSRWQFELTGLADALMAQALEAGAIDVAVDNPFWEPFTRTQCRDIVAALASLGYRFDGLGGFADGRVPSQRDLSLAVGYAGLDPMRIRIWPSEAEMRGLLADASVAADEYLAGAAGGLTLGELVALLGPRADGLTDLWNEWGRVRPRLLATD